MDIFVITETWHEDSSTTVLKQLCSPGFRFLDAARPMPAEADVHTVDFQNHGGLTFIHRSTVGFQKTTLDCSVKTFEFLCSDATSGSSHFVLLGIYQPASHSCFLWRTVGNVWRTDDATSSSRCLWRPECACRPGWQSTRCTSVTTAPGIRLHPARHLAHPYRRSYVGSRHCASGYRRLIAVCRRHDIGSRTREIHSPCTEVCYSCSVRRLHGVATAVQGGVRCRSHRVKTVLWFERTGRHVRRRLRSTVQPADDGAARQALSTGMSTL